MNKAPSIRLDHINIPAQHPEWLADWYAENFDLKSDAGFVFGNGTVLVFVQGEPVDYRGRVHFGFRAQSKLQILKWAEKLGASINESDQFCGFKTKDPEGNCFELYWEDSSTDVLEK